jgi:hypothetical protein
MKTLVLNIKTKNPTGVALTSKNSPQYGLFLGASREQVTFERSQTIAYSKMREFFTMSKGDYGFLFEIPLSGALYDTLTGPKHEYHAYRVEVSVDRWMWPNLVISQPLRVHRYPMLSTGLGLSNVIPLLFSRCH